VSRQQRRSLHPAFLCISGGAQESISALFNETAFWQYFSVVQGMPYGCEWPLW